MNRKLLTVIIVTVLSFFTFVKLSLAEKVTIDSKGFLLIDGVQFFPIGMFSVYPYPTLPGYGLNVSLGNQNLISEEIANPPDPGWGMVDLYRRAKESNLYNIPHFSGTAMPKAWQLWNKPPFNLDPATNWTDAKADAAIIWAKQFVNDVKGKNGLLAYYPIDEAGVNWRDDPRLLDLYAAIKAADPNHPTIAVDNIWYPLKKVGDLLGYDSGFAPELDNYKLRKADETTRAVWGSPYVDIVVPESGNFSYFTDGKFPCGPLRQACNPLEHLIGTMEYARQVTNDNKPIWTVFSVQNWGLPGTEGNTEAQAATFQNHWATKEEIRSFFYTAMGHGVRGVLVYQWRDINPDKLNLPGAQDTLQSFKKVVDEIRGEVLPDYLQGQTVTNRFTSTSSPQLDISSFCSPKNGAVYLIAVNIGTAPINNANISFPSLSQTVQVQVVGKGGTFSLPKRSNSLTISLAPFQTQVFKWRFTDENLAKFLGQAPGTTKR